MVLVRPPLSAKGLSFGSVLMWLPVAEKLRLAWPLSAATRLRNHYSHFFHLNMRYGTIAAASIISKAIG